MDRRSFSPKMAKRAPFWLLVALILVCFFTGGSSWGSELQLMLLRPLALAILGCAILTFRLEDFGRHWVVWVIFFGAALLTAAHLVPLPFSWWSVIPGRDIIVSMDQAAGLGQISRPLSMSPDATLNALYSLSVPLAVVVLAVQLSSTGHRHILALLIMLASLSGLIGILQIGGANLNFYPEQSEAAGLFANRNHQVTLLAMIVPMSVACVSMASHKNSLGPFSIFLGLAPALVIIPLILITGSRTGFFVALIGLAISFLIFPSRVFSRGERGGIRTLLPISFAGLTCFLISATIVASRDNTVDRIINSQSDLRWPVWKSILENISQYMPWGVGIGSYAQAYQVLEPDVLLRPRISNHAHNEFLEVAFTAGIPGVILLSIAAWALAASLWSAYWTRDDHSSGNSGVFARLGSGLIALLAFASVTDYPVRTPILAIVFALASVWASLGISARRKQNYSKVRNEHR